MKDCLLKLRKKLTLNDEIEAKDLVPNPILIKNKNNIEIISEKVLQFNIRRYRIFYERTWKFILFYRQ